MHIGEIMRTVIKIVLGLSVLMALQGSLLAQKRLVDQVKQDVNNMSLTVDNYKDAINKIEPALTNEETKDEAEAWYTAGDLNFKLYDKCLDLKSIGQSVDENLMYSALIVGYDKMLHALKLDSVPELDKKGNPKLDKNGRPKVKTKFSKKIVETLYEHFA